ncbi:MAG: sigma 54-interacting transcriptional regulator [Planctomycetia bacterium]|nr:sigma 54-interacting transcriptional regulator [Planctomycetia bacterium]
MVTNIANLILLRDNIPVGAFFVSPDKETRLGRSTRNDVILTDDRCSRFHAVIRKQDDSWQLVDLGSRNGTGLNDKLVNGQVGLKNGDRIQIGHDLLFFCITQTSGDGSSGANDSMKYSQAVSDTLAVAVSQLNEQKELTAHLERTRNENAILRSMLLQQSEIVGEGSAIQQVNYLISRAAPSKATVLVRGESGVGKELVARAIHANSPRSKSTMICLNCAAISESLLASELFGHEKGAFTGATEKKIGKFEAANGGTLFLDEIAEMSPSLQAKFLRVLEGQPFERVGGNKPINVDVRVIAATNRDLETEVDEGRFRHDLFFRLHVLEITVPPLRKRPEDIPLLAHFFLEKFSQETNRRFTGFSPDAQSVLRNYRWPGNVRELKNVIERAVLMANPPVITPEDLLLSSLRTTGNTSMQELPHALDLPFVPKTMEQAEEELITATLEYFNWNKSNTAKSLGIERTTLDRKINRYKIKRV